MAQTKKRTSPAQFMKEVRQEGSKVTWTTRKETAITTLMVFIMVVIAAIFFLIVDTIFGGVIGLILNYFA